jgi:hypothetical protein
LINSTSITPFVLTGIAIANLFASVCVLRSAVYSNAQRGLQIALVWVLPLLGAAAILSVWAHDRNSTARDHVSSGEGSNWLPGIGPLSDRSHPTSTFGDFDTHDGNDGDGGGGHSG